jgi:hypothetical protein
MPELSDVEPRIQYTANGGETEFDFPFLVYSDAEGSSSHLIVIRVRDGEPETLATPADYSVADLDEEDGGTITLEEAAEADDIYILYREVPIETFFSFATAGDYFAEDVNKQNNLILQILQQLALAISRSATLPPESTLESLALPSPEALKLLRWNSDASALENTPSPDAGDFTDQLAKVSANDTNARYLAQKLVAGNNVTLTELNDGADETLRIAFASNPLLAGYTETVDLHGSAAVGATETIDASTANVHKIILDVNCTLTFSGAPTAGVSAAFTLFVTQDSSGGNTITWPASVAWEGGVEPPQTTTANKTDIYTFSTLNAGTTWYGFNAGRNF